MKPKYVMSFTRPGKVGDEFYQVLKVGDEFYQVLKVRGREKQRLMEKTRLREAKTDGEDEGNRNKWWTDGPCSYVADIPPEQSCVLP